MNRQLSTTLLKKDNSPNRFQHKRQIMKFLPGHSRDTTPMSCSTRDTATMLPTKTKHSTEPDPYNRDDNNGASHYAHFSDKMTTHTIYLPTSNSISTGLVTRRLKLALPEGPKSLPYIQGHNHWHQVWNPSTSVESIQSQEHHDFTRNRLLPTQSRDRKYFHFPESSCQHQGQYLVQHYHKQVRVITVTRKIKTIKL